MGQGCCDGFMRCLGRIPVASLIAFILFGLGVTVYLGAALTAFDSVSNFFQFELDVKGIIVPLYIVFLALGTFFVVFAFLTTGETRKEVCHKECCNVTGRIVQAVCIFVTWVLNVGFVIISGMTLIPLVVFLVMKLACETKFAKALSECVTLPAIGPMSSKNNTICGDKAKDFCVEVDNINNNMIVAYVASIIVCMSLIQFLMAMSANYVHMKDEVAGHGYEDLDKPQKPEPVPAPVAAP